MYTQFPDVVILDFFASIPGEADQKAWVKLIKDKLIDGEGTKKAPHLESQIKSLYTAITRCCDRLVFVETKETKAGKEFFRLVVRIHFICIVTLCVYIPYLPPPIYALCIHHMYIYDKCIRHPITYFYYIIVIPIYTSYAYGHSVHLPYMRVISTRPIIPVFTFPMYILIYARV